MSLYHYVFLLVCFTTVECKPFRFNYTSYPGVPGQFKLHNIPATWKDARLICDREGAVLASPTNDSMKHALDAALEGLVAGCSVFTGVSAIYGKGYFHSIEGVPLDDMPLQWLPGEPDNADDNEACIAYVGGSVADVNCSEVLPFVCYRRDAPAPIAPGPCRLGYTMKNGDHCYKWHTEKRTWHEAAQVCSAEGALLAPDVIGPNIVFIGARDWTGRGDWRTVYGHEVNGTEWKNETLSTDGLKTCGIYVGTAQPRYYTGHSCDDTLPYVCEYYL